LRIHFTEKYSLEVELFDTSTTGTRHRTQTAEPHLVADFFETAFVDFEFTGIILLSTDETVGLTPRHPNTDGIVNRPCYGFSWITLEKG
jgi:hypothetical protein